MSPLSIRRYRAERLLRADFERLRGAVIALAQRRLAAAGVHLDRTDLDAAYAHAWHGLYAAMLDGEHVENPTAWLAVVTYRRAIDECRARARARAAATAVGACVPVCARGAHKDTAGVELDLASALDDRIRLRQLIEGLRSRLSARELQAASLCYLQGLPRAQAAAQMGVSDAAMRRLMDGRRGRSGVAHKFGSLVGTISSGDWCAEQGSLMRGLAYGILDPDGERYQHALSHQRECSACRAYVLSLRGLAAVLPPLPVFLRWSLAGGAGTGGAAAGVAGVSAASQGGGAVGAASAGGAAGGGWLIAGAGPVATKLAVGCLLALGLGAGCVTLAGGGHRHRQGAARVHARAYRASTRMRAAPLATDAGAAALAGERGQTVSARALARPAAPSASERAPREFGPELGGASAGSAQQPSPPRASTASASSVPTQSQPSPTPPRPAPTAAEPSAGAAATREFSPG